MCRRTPGATDAQESAMRSYFIETWGCQMNLHDSERLEGQLLSLGLGPSPDVERADLVLLNTCSVREKAAQKIVSRIGELALLPSRPMIGVCGCVAEQEGQALLARSRAVSFVLGPGQITRLGEALAATGARQRLVLTGFPTAAAGAAPGPVARRAVPRGMITVVEGCNQRCTFCVVPYTRGPEVSRPMSEILAEASALVADGVQEVELLGQTVNAYRCPATGAPFPRLLAAVAGIPGVARLRYVTSHPRFFDDALIDTIASHPNVSRYLHLPVQAGSDRVLRRMGRRYDRSQYVALVGRIRAAVPDINLSTDAIVGFPGESEADFGETLGLLEELRFGLVFGFAFSPRPRTPAARYRDQVPEPVRRERLQRLFELTDRISEELNRAFLGRVVAVLVDGYSRRSESDWQGRGEDNRVVNFPRSDGERVGDTVDVRVTRVGPHWLYGERVVGPADAARPGGGVGHGSP
jgi:tRNA-2-methylthio-N6-dimethylallyladenosine synthase